METKKVEASLVRVEKDLQKSMANREKLLKEGRDVISASSKTIVHLHTKKFSEAGKELERAAGLLRELKRGSEPSLVRYVISPESEFVEASVVSALVRGKSLPSADDLDVRPESYILGLLDSIGEMKRLLLDAITQGRIKEAQEAFASMEALYLLLSPFATFDNLVSGTRRKIDVARMLIEDSRGILAEETRREALGASIDRLYKKLSGGRAR